MTDRYAERFTFTPGNDGHYWLNCVKCPEPLGSWHPEQIDLMLSPDGQAVLREVAAAHDRTTHPGPDVPAVPPIIPGELLVPLAWCVRYGLKIRGDRHWEDGAWTRAMTLPEFSRRARRSTQGDLAAWDRFVKTVPEEARTERRGGENG